MENNGGYATLGYLYQNVDVKDWKTKTPFASIRRIVQDSRFFFKIRPGLWALNDYREEVLEKFDLSTGENKQENLFNHTYYQGLIVEIGNLKNFETHVPNQDKNKPFLERPLKEVSSLQNIYEFSYPTIVKRASTIDVIWFNHRKLPYAFFEVEHSTPIYTGLLRFNDVLLAIPSLNATLGIVSNDERRSLFAKQVSRPTFISSKLKESCSFLNYDDVYWWYKRISVLKGRFE